MLLVVYYVCLLDPNQNQIYKLHIRYKNILQVQVNDLLPIPITPLKYVHSSSFAAAAAANVVVLLVLQSQSRQSHVHLHHHRCCCCSSPHRCWLMEERYHHYHCELYVADGVLLQRRWGSDYGTPTAVVAGTKTTLRRSYSYLSFLFMTFLS